MGFPLYIFRMLRILGWLSFIALLVLAGVNIYFYQEVWQPTLQELQDLKVQNEKLLKALGQARSAEILGTTPSEPTSPPSLLEGVSTPQDTLSLTIRTLQLFVRYKPTLSSAGKKVLQRLTEGISSRSVQQVEIRMYQGPYKTLTQKRLQALKRYFINAGVPASRIRVMPDDHLKKWTTSIRIRF